MRGNQPCEILGGAEGLFQEEEDAWFHWRTEKSRLAAFWCITGGKDKGWIPRDDGEPADGGHTRPLREFWFSCNYDGKLLQVFRTAWWHDPIVFWVDHFGIRWPSEETSCSSSAEDKARQECCGGSARHLVSSLSLPLSEVLYGYLPCCVP